MGNELEAAIEKAQAEREEKARAAAQVEAERKERKDAAERKSKAERETAEQKKVDAFATRQAERANAEKAKFARVFVAQGGIASDVDAAWMREIERRTVAAMAKRNTGIKL